MRLWTRRSIAAAVALAAGATGAQGADGGDGDPAAVCDNEPVSMVAVRFPCLAHAVWPTRAPSGIPGHIKRISYRCAMGPATIP